jgi:DNA-binding transcriptional MocR family regulator
MKSVPNIPCKPFFKPFLDTSLHVFSLRAYAFLASGADPSGRCYSSAKAIAKAFGVSLRYGHKAIAELRDKGYISRIDSGLYSVQPIQPENKQTHQPVAPPQPKPTAHIEPPQPNPGPAQQGSTPRITINIFGDF